MADGARCIDKVTAEKPADVFRRRLETFNKHNGDVRLFVNLTVRYRLFVCLSPATRTAAGDVGCTDWYN